MLAVVFIAIISLGCDPNELCQQNSNKIITVNNNSSRNIIYYFYWNYPDTLFGEHNPLFSSPSSHRLSPFSNGQWRWPRDGCWEEAFSLKSSEFIYIFDTDTLETYSWQEIQDGYKILARYELTLQSLIDSGWVVNYPR